MPLPAPPHTSLTWVFVHLCRDDRPLIPLTAPFAFADKGHIDITLRDIGMYRRHDQVCVGMDVCLGGGRADGEGGEAGALQYTCSAHLVWQLWRHAQAAAQDLVWRKEGGVVRHTLLLHQECRCHCTRAWRSPHSLVASPGHPGWSTPLLYLTYSSLLLVHLLLLLLLLLPPLPRNNTHTHARSWRGTSPLPTLVSS